MLSTSIAVALAVWCVVSVVAALFVGRILAVAAAAPNANDVRKAA
jgi:uncharacterized membrane protein